MLWRGAPDLGRQQRGGWIDQWEPWVGYLLVLRWRMDGAQRRLLRTSSRAQLRCRCGRLVGGWQLMHRCGVVDGERQQLHCHLEQRKQRLRDVFVRWWCVDWPERRDLYRASPAPTAVVRRRYAVLVSEWQQLLRNRGDDCERFDDLRQLEWSEHG